MTKTIEEIRQELRNSGDRNLTPLARILTDKQIATLREAFKDAGRSY